MNKYGIIIFILVAVAVVVGFVFLGSNNAEQSTEKNSVAVKNAATEEACAGDCSTCEHKTEECPDVDEELQAADGDKCTHDCKTCTVDCKEKNETGECKCDVKSSEECQKACEAKHASGECKDHDPKTCPKKK